MGINNRNWYWDDYDTRARACVRKDVNAAEHRARVEAILQEAASACSSTSHVHAAGVLPIGSIRSRHMSVPVTPRKQNYTDPLQA